MLSDRQNDRFRRENNERQRKGGGGGGEAADGEERGGADPEPVDCELNRKLLLLVSAVSGGCTLDLLLGYTYIWNSILNLQ